MSWNFRVLAHKDGDDFYYQIHEVYYNRKGKPESYTEKGVSIGSDCLDGIKWTLKEMKKCLKKPILSVENFPKKHKLKK